MAVYTHFSGAIDPSLENLFYGGFSISSFGATSFVVSRADAQT